MVMSALECFLKSRANMCTDRFPDSPQLWTGDETPQAQQEAHIFGIQVSIGHLIQYFL